MNFSKILCIAASLFLGACNSPENPVIQSEYVVQLDSVPGNCPYLTKDHKGNIVMSWVRRQQDSGHVFCYAISVDGGNSFSAPIIIPGSDNIQPHGENLPKIIFKPSGETIALWGAANPSPRNKYSGMVYYSQSFDGGVSWSKPTRLVKDTAGNDQRYYDVALLENGEAAIMWLDNRKIIPQEGSSLYYAVTQGRSGFQNERMIGEGCCPCCRTDLFIDSKSGIHVLYRGILQDSIRDMVHRVSIDGGNSFSAPVRISNDNWVINGCPHTGPSMTENRAGLHFAWFTGGSRKGSYYTRSVDNGKSFKEHDQVSLLGSHPQLAALSNGALAIVWDETVSRDGKFNKRIGMQVRGNEGTAAPREFITPDSSIASYPVITSVNNHIIVAYAMKKGNHDFIFYQRLKR